MNDSPTNVPEGEIRAILVREIEGKPEAALRQVSEFDLPEGDVLVRVRYSSLNYKDGLAITGKAKVLRSLPMIPGIDLAGEVVSSADSRFSPGDEVLATGWGLGEKQSGGMAQLARVQGDWLQKLPEELDARRAMAFGTAGLTAMLCVMALQRAGLKAGDEVVVTGASGGVGTVAVHLLARLGARVTASSGKPEAHGVLRDLGAADIVGRDELPGARAPLGSERWAGAVDTVGGETLAGLLRTMRYGGTVAACGLAQSGQLSTTVLPFILRGVTLAGVDSVYAPRELRDEAWARLAREFDRGLLDALTEVAGLERTVQLAHEIVGGRVQGRVVVDVDA